MAGLQAPQRNREYESASSVATYHQCGEQYRRKYIAGERDGDNLPAVAGNVLHGLFDEDAKGTAPADILAEAKLRLRAVEGLEALAFWGRQNAEYWLREGLGIRVGNYLTVREAWASHVIESSEQELYVQLADDVTLKSFIDRVHLDSTGRRVCIDWKTGKKKDFHTFQMELYRVAYNVLHPDAPADHSTLVYLGGKSPEFVHVPATLTVESAADVVRRVNTADTFPFSGVHSGACGLCWFRSDCLPGQVGERTLK